MYSRVTTSWCLAVFILFSSPSFAQEAVEQLGLRERHRTADFVNVVNRVEALANTHGVTNVLLVVDIDNTLLAMNQDLGSDQWFNWQNSLLDSDPDSPDLVADDFPGLLEVQGTLFSLSGMHAPEPELPDLVKRIQDSGVTTVVLTSRGPDYRDAAERELTRNRYDFTRTTLTIKERRGLFMPFDPERPNAHGLSPEIIEMIVSRRRPVTYSNGIYMTAGQHKGYMLKTLLARADPRRSFDAVVFVDDHERHTQRVHMAFEDDDIAVVTFQYTREDGNVANFNSSSKSHVVHDWSRLDSFIDSVLVK